MINPALEDIVKSPLAGIAEQQRHLQNELNPVLIESARAQYKAFEACCGLQILQSASSLSEMALLPMSKIAKIQQEWAAVRKNIYPLEAAYSGWIESVAASKRIFDISDTTIDIGSLNLQHTLYDAAKITQQDKLYQQIEPVVSEIDANSNQSPSKISLKLSKAHAKEMFQYTLELLEAFILVYETVATSDEQIILKYGIYILLAISSFLFLTIAIKEDDQ